jgi:hypothetical protein
MQTQLQGHRPLPTPCLQDIHEPPRHDRDDRVAPLEREDERHEHLCGRREDAQLRRDEEDLQGHAGIRGRKRCCRAWTLRRSQCLHRSSSPTHLLLEKDTPHEGEDVLEVEALKYLPKRQP